MFFDRFDNEADGAAPANWTNDGTNPLNTLEIDNAYSDSPPNSMKCATNGADGYIRHATQVTNGKAIYFDLCNDNANTECYIRTQDDNNDASGAKTINFIRLDTDNDISYYSGGWIDTGYNWGLGWGNWKIVNDFGFWNFDLWFGNVQIVNNGGLYNNLSPIEALHFGINDGNGSDTIWIDNVQMGDGWHSKINGEYYPNKINGITRDNIAAVIGQAGD